MPKRSTTDFDAIVIGAGHNGLITAAYLARSGLSTLLLEARPDVGGTASSEIYEGTTVNICNCDHLAFRTTPVSEELGLGQYGLSYIDVDPPQINGDWSSEKFWALYHDVDQTIDALASVHPESAAQYQDYVRTMLPVARLIIDAASRPPSRMSLLGTVMRHGGRGLTSLLKMSKMSAADVMRQFFTNDAVIGPAMVEGPVVWGVSPETPGTGLGALSYVLRHTGILGRPVGGSGSLPNSIKQSFLSHGGMLRVNTRVTGILCEGNRVSAVQTGDGATMTARIVVSACDPRRTFVQWLKNPPARAQSLIDRWEKSQVNEGYESKIDAVTSVAPILKGLADPQLINRSHGSTTIISPSLAELHRGAQLMREGRTMPRMALLTNSPAVIDPSLAPPSLHVFSMEALYTPYSFQDGWESKHEPERWLRQYSSLVQPEFLDSIISWRVLTPHNYETEFHLPKGHATSFTGGPLAAFIGSTPELTRYHTPIRGLYLTGAATFPGAGVWGASGRNTAMVILAQMK